jgi:DNA polymerase-1
MHSLFYEDLAQPVIRHKISGLPTLNDEALQKISKREPLLRPLINSISDERTLGVLRSTFIEMPLDNDQRARTSFNICGADTFRFSSSENAFGSGGNLQNIPSDKSKMVGKAAERAGTGIPMLLPNVRQMFVPDEGYTFFDLDLERADLHVVVWEANDREFKDVLRESPDIHMENAKVLFGPNATKLHREFAKVFCHGTNYGGSPRTMAVHVGVTVHEAEKMQTKWFSAHPGIKQWHIRTAREVSNGATIRNKFGYQKHFFDRPSEILNEALAWVPQSTVACVINRAWMNIFNHLPFAQQGLGGVLLQVHDSLAGQFPTDHSELVEAIRNESLISVPYDDPLKIPVNIKISQLSWGDCGETP